ncbi:MAG: VOC family protein [Burkholderiaceae bacterium]|nr:VOC family protein [Burkholderiaceae bacterium]
MATGVCHRAKIQADRTRFVTLWGATMSIRDYYELLQLPQLLGRLATPVTLCLDHIFICADVGAPESQALLDAGLVEGARNVHPGQGTANRRFFFDRGFLELLWVHDEQEAISARTKPTRLWERWSQRTGQANPFGLCFSSQSEADHPLPFDSWAYEPVYLPSSKRIHFARGTALSEPELFALSWPQLPANRATQPTAHKVRLTSMLGVSVGMADTEHLTGPMRAARDAGLIRIHGSPRPELLIDFSSTDAIELRLPALGITLVGHCST